MNLTGKLQLNITDKHIFALGHTVSFNITDIGIDELHVDPTFKLMEMYDGGARVGIRDFVSLFSFNYEFIMDPPLLGDIGVFSLLTDNVTFRANASTDFDHDAGFFEVDFSEFLYLAGPTTGKFDGYDDILNIMSRFVTYAANVISRRVQSIVRYKGYQGINNLVNKIISLIPYEINIPGSDIYLEGGISDKFTILANDYISIPYDIALGSTRHYPNFTNDHIWPPVDIPEEYEIQMMMNDYLINSFLHIAYTEGWIHFLLPVEVTTTELEILTELKMHGWQLGCPCQVGVYSPAHD